MKDYGAKELAASFRTVRKNTIQIAEDIPENQYGFKPAPDTRSVAQTLVHIAVASDFPHQIHSSGISDISKVDFSSLFQKVSGEETKSRTKDEIIALLKNKGEEFASYLENLPEAFLSERVTMQPGSDPATKTRFEMLLGAKEHEMHHRGQLMTIERLVGVVPHLTRQFQERMARTQAQAQRQAN